MRKTRTICSARSVFLNGRALGHPDHEIVEKTKLARSVADALTNPDSLGAELLSIHHKL
jgi:hypothetical protein